MAIRYRRVLLKMSGEVLAGANGTSTLSRERLDVLAAELQELQRHDVQVAVVVGGGNIFRGASSLGGVDRVTGDHMGMLATVINSLAVYDALDQCGVPGCVMSAIRIDRFTDLFEPRAARASLEAGRVVILAAGTGNPFFTTDTAGVLRAVEIGADVLLKGTKVDGVYDADPKSNPQAVRFRKLTYDEALRRDLRVMDATAFALARDNDLPIVVFDVNRRGDLLRIVEGEDVGTLVEKG